MNDFRSFSNYSVAVVGWLIIAVSLCCGSVFSEFERKVGRTAGDFIIGALFPVHQEPDGHAKNDPFQCGAIRENYGIQRVEAAFFAIDQINNDSSLLPGVKLGIEIRDSCWSSPIALQQTIRIIENGVPNDEDENTCSCEENNWYPLIGVLGPGNSESTIQVQNILQTFRIPQIGYSATSSDLSDKKRFPYFLRLVPPDMYQVIIMVDLLKYYNWTYVSIINDPDNYGRSGANLFKEWSQENSICVARSLEVYESDYDDIVDSLAKDDNVRVIVCFCDATTIKGITSAIRLSNYTDRFTLIGSDGWASRTHILKGVDEEIRGSIVLSIDSPYADDFDPYYFSRKPSNNKRNPWYSEFWQDKFKCSLNSTVKRNNNITSCTGKEDLSVKYRQDSKVSTVIKSIYTLAHGLHDMITNVCNGTNLTSCNKLYPLDGGLFKDYLANVSFEYKEERIHFNKDLDPVPKYKIFNYQKLNNGTYCYVQIGHYMKGMLKIWGQAKFRSERLVTSVCSLPCKPGYYRNRENQGLLRTACCWSCIPCQSNEIADNESMCVPCSLGYWPNNLKTNCTRLTPIYIQWGDVQSIVSLVYANFGIVVTLITAIIFVKHNDTPVVKSSTKELSYLMLFGMLLAHCCTYAFISVPSFLSCYVVRILPPLSLTIIYSALLVKTNRIARILAISKKKFPNMRPRFMSTSTQICICLTIIFVQICICSYLLITEPATPKFFYPDYSTVVLGCRIPDQGIIVQFSFNALLVVLCTFYAVKTRNLPQNFNEAKFIGFSMYTTCITWVAFCLVYYGSKLKIITMCVSVSTVALVILIFLFTPKIYIILFHPEKNTRAHFITSKGIRCYIGCVNSTHSNAGSVRTTSSYEAENSDLPKNNLPQENGKFKLKKPSTDI